MATRDQDNVKNPESARNRRALKSCRRVLRILADIAIVRGKGIRLDSLERQAIAGLYSKGRTTLRAVLLLFARDYVEDAIILSRSLANLAIDLVYISREDSNVRVLQWQANGLNCKAADDDDYE